MRALYFIVPTFQNSITGGSLYDYQVIKYLKKKYVKVILKEVEHTIPTLRINKLIKSFPSKAKILIDGYLSNKINKSSFTYDISLLVHHPCALENNDYIFSDINLFLKEKRCFSNAKKIITVSKTIMKIVKKISNTKNNIFIAYPGIEKDYYDLIDKSNRKRMISIGNIIPRKGYHNLIEALKNIEGDWRLNIVGNRNLNHKYYSMIKSKIDEYNLNSKVKFIGQSSNKNMIDLISKSSIFILPTRYEGFGMSILECAAAGLEIITSDIPVLREVLNGLSVTYVKKDNINELELTIRSKLKDNNIRYDRRAIEKYNWNNTAKKISRALYE